MIYSATYIEINLKSVTWSKSKSYKNDDKIFCMFALDLEISGELALGSLFSKSIFLQREARSASSGENNPAACSS